MASKCTTCDHNIKVKVAIVPVVVVLMVAMDYKTQRRWWRRGGVGAGGREAAGQAAQCGAGNRDAQAQNYELLGSCDKRSPSKGLPTCPAATR